MAILSNIRAAYAKYHRIQWRVRGFPEPTAGEALWMDYELSPPKDVPLGDDQLEWRICHEVKLRYKVALLAPGGVECLGFAQSDWDVTRLEASEGFVRWLTDWDMLTIEKRDPDA